MHKRRICLPKNAKWDIEYRQQFHQQRKSSGKKSKNPLGLRELRKKK